MYFILCLPLKLLRPVTILLVKDFFKADHISSKKSSGVDGDKTLTNTNTFKRMKMKEMLY